MMKEFARSWNVTGKTWVVVEAPGPWAIDNSLDYAWGILNTETGKTKKMGRAAMRGVNYFDRSKDEANKRNLALLAKMPLTVEAATVIIAENPAFVSGDDNGSSQETARLVLDRMCSEIYSILDIDDALAHRTALLEKLSRYKAMK